MRKVIINADDFGLNKSVNKAIIDTYKMGNLSSTTLMVNMPGTQDAVELAKENPNLGIGLHFCITEGKPLTNATTLITESGEFISRGKLVKDVMKGKIDLNEVKSEFQAQLELIKSYGLNFTHVDSHQHTMMIPQIFKSIVPILNENKINVRLVKPYDFDLKLLMKRPKKFILQGINTIFANKNAKQSYVKSNDYLTSVHELDHINSFNSASYIELLEKAPGAGIVELMVHPYILDEALKKWYGNKLNTKMPFISICEKEYKCLTEKPLFLDYKLLTFKDI